MAQTASLTHRENIVTPQPCPATFASLTLVFEKTMKGLCPLVGTFIIYAAMLRSQVRKLE